MANILQDYLNEQKQRQQTEEASVATGHRYAELEKNITTELNAEYARILVEASSILSRGIMVSEARSEFVKYVEDQEDGFYTDLVLALLDGEEFQKIAWELVEENVSDILWKIFPEEEEESAEAPSGDWDVLAEKNGGVSR